MTVSTTTVPVSRREPRAFAIFGVVLALIAGAAFVLEQRAVSSRAAAAQALAAELAAEGKAFCERYGMPASSQAHAACVKDLQAMRDSQTERMNRDNMIGL